jgi:hypothetical protein
MSASQVKASRLQLHIFLGQFADGCAAFDSGYNTGIG